MGDYYEIMTGGQFTAAGAIPNFFSISTDGWWNTEVGGGPSGAHVMSIVPIIHHQHMRMH